MTAYPLPTSVPDCYVALAETKDLIADLNDQLFEAKQNQKLTGEYADPVWFRTTNYKLDKAEAQLTRLKGTLIRLKRQENMLDGFYDAIGRIVVEEWDAADLGDVVDAVSQRYPEYAEVVESVIRREAV